MNQESLEDFLREDQKRLLEKSIEDIILNLKKLPVKLTSILKQCQSANIKYLLEIDPEGNILIEKLANMNQEAIFKLFHSTCQPIITIITQNIDIYFQQHSLRFLKSKISDQVNQICGSKQFSLRIQHSYTRVGSSLWENIHDQIIEISMGIYGFMHNYFQMIIDQSKREVQVEQFLEVFRDKFQGKIKLSKTYVLSQRLEEQMKQKMNESMMMGDIQREDEWAQVINQIDHIQKYVQQTQQQKQKQSQQAEVIQNKKNNKNVFGLIKDKAQQAFKSVKGFVSIQPKQKSISSIQLSQNLEHYLQNLQTYHEISDNQKQFIMKIAQMDIQHILNQLQQEFDLKELSIIKYAINNPIKNWDQYQKAIGYENQLCNQSTCLLITYSEHLQKSLRSLKQGNKKQPHGEFLLTALLYRTLQNNYSPFTKRYLCKVLRVIQRQFTRNNPIYVRGSLRYFQATTIKSTKLANLLSNLKPQRSKDFQLSNKSMMYLKKNIFEDEKRIEQMVNSSLKEIRVQNSLKELQPQIELMRLNSADQSKVITIAISGFLSQDTDKDMQWLGLIRALENTELYAFNWKSSTFKEIGRYLASKAGNFVVNPINLTGTVGIITNVINLGINLVNQYKTNPFAQAHVRAAQAGLYLAELILKIFPDRFINLVGFSLGTEVVCCCLERLALKGKTDIINRVVTLGGVAKHSKVKDLLQKGSTSLQLMNLWSESDYAVRFIYRICRFGSMPLGAGDLKLISGHQITSINATKFVKSHLDFRSNLYGIGLLTGMIHD